MCVHTVSQSSLSVPCNRVVMILRPVWWSCMTMLATCSKFSQAAPPLSRPNPRRFLWAAGGRCLVVVEPSQAALGALLGGCGASDPTLPSGGVGWGLVVVHLLEF
jgi:hypothetical protein